MFDFILQIERVKRYGSLSLFIFFNKNYIIVFLCHLFYFLQEKIDRNLYEISYK
jgi:hypothetical protein